MENTKIEEALTRLFNEEDRRIVFWNDPDLEFAITLSLLNLPEGISILRLDQIGALEAKIQIEQIDPEGRYLLYSSSEEPDYEADWLLDIRLYSFLPSPQRDRAGFPCSFRIADAIRQIQRGGLSGPVARQQQQREQL